MDIINNDKLELTLEQLDIYEQLTDFIKNSTKKELLLEVYDVLFPNLTMDEKQQISINVEFLLDNKQIKKLGAYKLYKAGVNEWFSKKFL